MRSKANRSLLKRFAVDKLKKRWAHMAERLDDAIELHIDDCIDVTMEACANWAITSDNIAEVNVSIWKGLRPRVEATLEGIALDPEEALQAMFNDSHTGFRTTEETPDLVVPERDHLALREAHEKAWSS